MPLDGLHVNRDRAESFGSLAEQYDRFRSTYPEALLDHLVALGPSTTLDVGCGTGKVAVGLAARGLDVVGVEPDERMAAIARRHGVRVDLASFEAWDSRGRRFDLITSGHAWHWIDPDVGLPKAASVLRSGGTIELFWNYHVLDGDLLSVVEPVYGQHAPELEVLGRDPSGGPDTDPFAGSDRFSRGETTTYRWERRLSADDWIGLLATFSDHRSLGPARLTALQQALHRVIQESGGVVHAACGTYVWSARKVRD